MALVVAGAPSTVGAQTPDSRLDAALRRQAMRLSGSSRVIVEFTGEPDVRAITRRGGTTGRRIALLRAQAAEIGNAQLAALATDPRVQRVSLDRPAFATLERSGAAIGAVTASRLQRTTGQGIGVAVIDSGVDASHDDLFRGRGASRRSVVTHFKDFTRTMPAALWTSEQAVDDYGHGTHVAGIIAGSGYDSSGARRGVATGADIIGLRVLDGEGHGYISDVIAAIDYAISVRTAYNIRVINLSVASGVGESYHTDPLTQAARRAVEHGIVVVASAGNLGSTPDGRSQYGGITAPGNAPWVLTVGASTHAGTTGRADDAVAAFSSTGPTWIDFAAKPDLVAPGVGIESLSAPGSRLYAELADYLLTGTRRTPDRPYLSLSGTSMAAPLVSGIVALMLEANPELTPNAVKAILQYTAEARSGQPVLAQGAGLLNAQGAVRLSAFFADPRRGPGRPGDVIAGAWTPWSRRLLWGNFLVEGGLPLPDANAWARTVTWGALATADGAPVTWGARALDGRSASTYDDENIVWSTRGRDNIVWSTYDDENIVWSTYDDENIVWSTRAGDDDNIVWSTYDDENIVWSTTYRNVVWGSTCRGLDCRTGVWGRARGSLIATYDDENIVWSTYDDDDNIVWSTYDDENIVWSTRDDENIVWSTYDDENIVWSTAQPVPTRWPAPRPTR
ncbi:MAG: S8 family peptidase [Vicinamibacterales bacterium]